MSDTTNEHVQTGALTPSAAARAILADINVLPVECIALHEASGRVLVSSVSSPIDLPHWDNAAMDGYAVRSEDLADAKDGIDLTVVEEIPAGAAATKSIGSGQCARIFTGAPIPKGADSVIRQEDTTRLANGRLRIVNTRDVGRNIRKRSEDIARGSTVLEQGTALSPAALGVLASVGSSEVYVHRKPRVAILATGDEIVELDERDAILNGQKLASSNTYTMLASVRLAGAEAINLGIARDDLDDIRKCISRASTADLLVTSGGLSVGEHDYMRPVLDTLGLDLRFWRIGMRPGAPVGFGFVRGLPWIGLPGNPVSTMVTFELFVRPAIRKMLGHARPFRATTRVRVDERIETPAPLAHFLRVRLRVEDDTLTATLTGPQGSGILTSMTKADALLIVPEGREGVDPGESLDAIILDEVRHVAEPPF